ncbi:MAG: CopD family protein [Methylocystis sp.]|uniref:CopD family protein n=1 Tax=Methylocystis sp. TaxID=1911079 RepID=UPI003D0B6F94
MIGAPTPLVPYFLAFHILTLALWCAGLIALPLMLSRHDPAISQTDYTRIRRYTHFAYTLGVTPAAVLAVASGTALVFLRDAFTPWMFLKLAFVGVLVLTHGWVGHTVTSIEETQGLYRPPHPALQAAATFIPILAILFLVLDKPDFSEFRFPQWLTQPQGGQLPFLAPSR